MKICVKNERNSGRLNISLLNNTSAVNFIYFVLRSDKLKNEAILIS